MKNENKFIRFLGYSSLTLVFAILGISIMILQTKEITVTCNNKTVEIMTLASNVEEFLKQNNIYIDDQTKLSANLEDKIEDKMDIEISSIKEYSSINLEELTKDTKVVTAKILEEKTEIPFETETINNPAIYRGVSKIKEEGKNGLKNTKYIVKYENDAEVSKEEISSNVEIEVVNKLVEVGTMNYVSTSRSNVVIPSVDSGFKVYNISLSQELQQYAYAMCKQYNIEYELFLAMMYKESGYRSSAIGGGNSYGLCQIHVSNHSRLRSILGISNFLDPYDNIKAGAYMLNLYLNSAGKISSEKEFVEVYGLNSYNMGEGAYFSKCYSQGIFHRSYSTSIRSLRDNLLTNGSL